jgi:3-oxoacyl-(acyl-carrier-protein) synthase
MKITSDLAGDKTDFVVASANGTFIDKAEYGVLSRVIPGAAVYTAKPALGESVGAGGAWQIIVGAKALLAGELPALLHLGSTIPLHVSASRMVLTKPQSAIVLSCGLNQQVAGLRLVAG